MQHRNVKVILVALSLILVSPLAFAGVRMGDGSKTITTAGTPLAITATSQLATTLWVCGDSGNTGKVLIGESPLGTAGSQQGLVLSAGGCASIFTTDPNNAFDISLIKADVTVSGEEVSFFWQYEFA